MSLADNGFTTPTSATTREKMLEERKKKKEKREKESNSLLFPLMNGEFPISILITQASLSAGLRITRNSVSNKSRWLEDMGWGKA